MLLVALAIALAPTPAAGDAAPAPVPSAQMLRAAEIAYAELRRIGDLTGPDPALDELTRRLSSVEREMDRLRTIDSPPLLGTALTGDVNYFRMEIARRDADAQRWDSQLEQRAEQIDKAVTSLRRLAGIWRLTVASQGLETPSALAARAVEVRDRASALEQVVRSRLTTILELQNRVLALKLTLADLLESVRAAEAARRQELFEIESTPLWRAIGPGHPLFSLVKLRALTLQARTVVRYVASESGRCIAQLVLFGVLTAVGLAVARKLRGIPRPEASSTDPVEVVSKHPIASGAVLALFATPLFQSGAPLAFMLLLFVAGLPPFFHIAGTLVPGWKRQLQGLAALFTAERLVALVPDLALLGRLVLLAIGILAFTGCMAGLRRGGWLRALAQGRWAWAILAAAAIAAALLAVSVVANAVGNVTLAELLAGATLTSACGVAVVAAGTVIFTGALRALLLLPWARRFSVIRQQEQLLLRRAEALLRGAAILTFAFWTLRAFHATEAFRAFAGSALAIRLKVGALDVSLKDVVAFAITLWVAVWLSRVLKFMLDEALLPSLEMPRGKAAAVSTTAKYLVVALGFSFATLAAGMEVTRFTVLAGTLGVGIGFGLQNVVNNFVCGLILLYEQPVQVGDLIEVGQLTGEVQRIGVRSSTVRTYQGADVIVPNSNFISAEVVNWTRSDRTRRVEIPIGVAYGSEPRRVEELLLDTARSHPGVAASPQPVVLLTGFAESALQFELRFWTGIDEWVATASGLRAAINQALSSAGIAIPFPQLDLWVRSAPPEAGKDRGVRGVARIEPPRVPRR